MAIVRVQMSKSKIIIEPPQKEVNQRPLTLREFYLGEINRANGCPRLKRAKSPYDPNGERASRDPRVALFQLIG